MRTIKSTPHCTVEDILELIEHMRTNEGMTTEELNKVPVFIERIHDVYFEKHNWKSVERPSGINDKSEYILAWSPVYGPDENGNMEFRIDGNY